MIYFFPIRAYSLDIFMQIQRISRNMLMGQEPHRRSVLPLCRIPQNKLSQIFFLVVHSFFHIADNLGDESLQHKIAPLLANILKILGVSKIEARAQFVDPSLLQIVSSFLCHHCLGVRHLDMLRGEEMPGHQIVEEFIRRYEGLVSQDLRCNRFLKAETRETSGIWEESGALENSICQGQLFSRLNIVKIAVQKQNFAHVRM
jgi:hypothetical protein